MVTEEERYEVFRMFEEKCSSIKHFVCRCCHMVGMNISVISKGKNAGCCAKCAKLRDKDFYLNRNALPVWRKNGTPMFTVPKCLECLSCGEKMLIQKVAPFLSLYHMKNGVMGARGHTCCFEQDIEGFVAKLPRSKDDVSLLRVLKKVQAEVGSDKCNEKIFKIRKDKVIAALRFLKEHSKEFRNIEIDPARMDWIEGNEGTLDGLIVDSDQGERMEEDNCENTDLGPSPSQVEPKEGDRVNCYGYVDAGEKPDLSEGDSAINDALQRAVAASPHKKEITIDWPKRSSAPVDEYGNSRIFAMAFPWLFPGKKLKKK